MNRVGKLAKKRSTHAVLGMLCAFLYSAVSFGQTDADPTTTTPPSAEAVPAIETGGDQESDTAQEIDNPEAAPMDPIEAELISRVNAEIDRRDEAETGADQTGLADATQGAVQSALRAIFALCIVLGLILLTYYSVKRWGKRVPILAGSSLGTVLGRLHLERGTTLHFVRTAGRVLVVGVNGNSVSLVADFDASSFAMMEVGDSGASNAAQPFNSDTFLAQLQASSQTMQPPAETGEEVVDEDEIAVLRGDIQRLQRYLREESREPQD